MFRIQPGCNLHENKCWPTGVTVRRSFVDFFKTKIEMNIVSDQDALIIFHNLPMIASGVRSDPKFSNRRQAFLTSQSFNNSGKSWSSNEVKNNNSMCEISRLILTKGFPLNFKWDANRQDI
jgi:hypothetical protein